MKTFASHARHQTVRLDNIEIPVSPRQAEILQAILEGEMDSQRLRERFYGPHYHNSTFNVHVSQLRARLAAFGYTLVSETVVHYRLEKAK